MEEWEEYVDTGKVMVDERVKEIGMGEGVACLSRTLRVDLPLIKRVEWK